MNRTKPRSKDNMNRRKILKQLGAAGLLGITLTGEAAGSKHQKSGRAEASIFFQKKIDQHGEIVGTEIKGLGKQGKHGGPSPDWRIKYTFEDGSKFPTFYNLTENSLKIRIAGKRFTIDRERYEQAISTDLEDRIENVEIGLDDDLGTKADELTQEQ